MFFLCTIAHNDTCVFNDITHIAFEFLVLMVACLSLWATSSKLSMLANTLDVFLNVAIGILQRANTPTAYRLSLAQLRPRREKKLLSNSPMIAQFLVLGIHNISTSTAHPQCMLSATSHTR